jgi:hypothetical protein
LTRCLEIDGVFCPQAVAMLRHLDEDVYLYVPYKYTVKGSIDCLKTSLGNLTDKIFKVDFNILNPSNPIIVPPHVRTPSGRPRTKRLTKQKRINNFIREREQLAERRGALIVHDEQRVYRQSYVCGICHEAGHNIQSCAQPHDGRGNYMSTETQNEYLRQGYLIIEIGLPGTTILPQTEQQFSEMVRIQQLERFRQGRMQRNEDIANVNVEIPMVAENQVGENAEAFLRNVWDQPYLSESEYEDDGEDEDDEIDGNIQDDLQAEEEDNNNNIEDDMHVEEDSHFEYDFGQGNIRNNEIVEATDEATDDSSSTLSEGTQKELAFHFDQGMLSQLRSYELEDTKVEETKEIEEELQSTIILDTFGKLFYFLFICF